MRRSVILIIAIILIGNSLAFCQKTKTEKLPWVIGQLPEKKGDYEYFISRGSGSTLKIARDDSYNSFLIDLGNNAGITVNSTTISEIKSNLNYSPDNSQHYAESNSMETSFTIKREGVTVSFSKVSEYYEQDLNNTYNLWELYEVSFKNSFKPYIPQYTQIYGMSAIWRSSLMYGWGQFYKKKTTKGAILIGSGAILLSGVFYTDLKERDNIRKSLETSNINLVKAYRSRADDWQTRKNIFIGSALGLYIYNVLDAGFSKGKVKYALGPYNITVSPYSEYAMASIKISLKF